MKVGPEMEPCDRIKAITDVASNVSINPDVKASHYIRSGKEMLRSAKGYQQDGNTENAFVLYMRFLTIFVEKLRQQHPGYKELPAAEKKLMTSYCNEILPKAEELRKELLSTFQVEYDEYKQHLEDMLRKDEENKKAERERNASNKNYQSQIVQKDSSSAGPSHHTTPDPKSPSAAGSDLSRVSYSNILNDVTQDKAIPSATFPDFDRRTKPNRFLSPMSSGLRPVVVPGDLIPVFLQCANRNTEKNVETCGFLTGKIMSGKLVVTDLIIPKQEGTADSCTALGEVEYSMIQDKLDLITFGWIHTHPSQTAFLSSVDMHTQYWYQQMMPEAIAIVCSPRKNQVGTFILNPDEGMEIIGKCQQTSFHQHPHTSVPLFIDATHHSFDTSLKVNVHDIR